MLWGGTDATEGQALWQPGGAEEDSHFREGNKHLHLAYNEEEEEVTAFWPIASKSKHWPHAIVRPAGKPLECQFFGHLNKLSGFELQTFHKWSDCLPDEAKETVLLGIKYKWVTH